jgi:hypothetical protein
MTVRTSISSYASQTQRITRFDLTATLGQEPVVEVALA